VGVIALGMLSHPVTSPAQGSEQSDGLRVIRAASDAAAGALLSGVAEGVFKEYERPQPGAAWDLKIDAKLQVAFDHGKYRIEIRRLAGASSKAKRQIIIHDGSAVFSSDFSEAIHPRGVEGNVFEAPMLAGMVRPQEAGFPWDVTRLAASLLDVGELLKHLSPERIQVQLSPEGDYVLRHPIPKSMGFVVLDCPRKYAFNVARRQVFGEDPDRPAFDRVATWKREGDVWYIDSYSEEAVLRGPGDRVREIRREMRYDKFTVNPKVPPHQFTMAALELPPGVRILDHRRTRSEAVHYVPYGDKELEKKAGSMVEQLKSLPVEPPRAPGVPPSPYRRVLFWSANAVLLGAVVVLFALLWRQRRKRNR
jgi:hypothetical protein